MFAATTLAQYIMKSKSISINDLLKTTGLNAIGKEVLLENKNYII